MSSTLTKALALGMVALIGANHPAASGQDKSKAMPAAKPGAAASEPKTATLGAGGGGKMMTRDELRECLRRQSANSDRRGELERTRGELEREKSLLIESGAALKTELEALDRSDAEAVTAYNAKAAERDARVDAWNQRNGTLNADAKSLDTEQTQWRADCAGRRYREGDEIAIQRGR